MGSRVSTATDCHPTFRMRALFVVFLATAAQCQQSQDDYAHDPSGDQGEPYVHDPTGDLTPFQLYKLRKGLASPNDLQQAAPAPQRAPVASRPAAVQPAFQLQNFQQAQAARPAAPAFQNFQQAQAARPAAPAFRQPASTQAFPARAQAPAFRQPASQPQAFRPAAAPAPAFRQPAPVQRAQAQAPAFQQAQAAPQAVGSSFTYEIIV